TSCWLFLTAQHTHANEPFYHYSSPRLLRDGKAEIEQLTNGFHKLFAALLAARKKEAKALHLQLQEAQEKNASTSRELEQAKSDAETQRQLNAEKDRLLEEYKTLLASQSR
ncbi:hypothetical protein B0H15DRAFT_794581, partial [Mycena belliarum]